MIDGEEKPKGPCAAIQKRSVMLAGHRTSVSLEAAFWLQLRLIAHERGQSLNQLVSEIDARRQGNLSSALRLYVLECVTARPERG